MRHSLGARRLDVLHVRSFRYSKHGPALRSLKQKKKLEKKNVEDSDHGDSAESNRGPRAPEARIMPLDHYPIFRAHLFTRATNAGGEARDGRMVRQPEVSAGHRHLAPSVRCRRSHPLTPLKKFANMKKKCQVHSDGRAASPRLHLDARPCDSVAIVQPTNISLQSQEAHATALSCSRTRMLHGACQRACARIGGREGNAGLREERSAPERHRILRESDTGWRHRRRRWSDRVSRAAPPASSVRSRESVRTNRLIRSQLVERCSCQSPTRA